jgi:hypothetical protein
VDAVEAVSLDLIFLFRGGVEHVDSFQFDFSIDARDVVCVAHSEVRVHDFEGAELDLDVCLVSVVLKVGFPDLYGLCVAQSDRLTLAAP